MEPTDFSRPWRPGLNPTAALLQEAAGICGGSRPDVALALLALSKDQDPKIETRAFPAATHLWISKKSNGSGFEGNYPLAILDPEMTESTMTSFLVGLPCHVVERFVATEFTQFADCRVEIHISWEDLGVRYHHARSLDRDAGVKAPSGETMRKLFGRDDSGSAGWERWVTEEGINKSSFVVVVDAKEGSDLLAPVLDTGGIQAHHGRPCGPDHESIFRSTPCESAEGGRGNG